LTDHEKMVHQTPSMEFSRLLTNKSLRLRIHMTFLIAVMSFANFVFYPLVVGSIIAVIIEQILRSKGSEDDPIAVRNVALSMGVRKYLIRQAWLFNIIWFVGYFILMLTVGRQQPAAMPDMLWQG